MRLLIGAALAAALLVPVLTPRPAAAEVVHLIPEDRASWRLRNIFAWVRARHFYGERKLEIESSPPGATLDLFYVRSNFQKMYEQTQAPATVILPRRVEAGPRDAVTIRAALAGYRQRQTSVRVSSKQEQVLLELEPLPNVLRALAHVYFAERASLSFLTDESATLRVQERGDGIHVVLAETGLDPELGGAVEELRSPLIEAVEALQLGEDLMLRVEYTPEARQAAFELRSRRSQDPIRGLHSYTLDLIPGDGGVEAVERARQALARISSRDVSGCALRFDETLRSGLDAAALSRALAPRGAFTDPYLRAAMKRLGELSPGGVVSLVDGSRFNTSAPLELAAATSQAAQVKGYLAILRTFVDALEPPARADQVLRSLIAPETDPGAFQQLLGRAESAESACRGRAAR